MVARSATTEKKGIAYGKKFGLDPERVKLTAGIKNFAIIYAVITESKKRYDSVDRDTDELVHGKISIAQFDARMEDGDVKKFYAPNSAIVEAIENIIKDPDFQYNKETGQFGEPCIINEVIQGAGEKGRKYIAFS
jgi:hypothetical protein